MLIQCNAMALDVTGIHGFDQTIDYGLRVDAGQVLINKIAKHDRSLAPKPNKRKGWFNLYYHIGGNVDNQDIKADRTMVKGDFVRSAQHRARIRQDLIDVFDQLLFTEESAKKKCLLTIGIPEGALCRLYGRVLASKPAASPLTRKGRRIATRSI
jgi:hypothetical protein